MFEVGDLIECIDVDNLWIPTALEIGQEYEVTSCTDEYVRIHGSEWAFAAWRFVKVCNYVLDIHFQQKGFAQRSLVQASSDVRAIVKTFDRLSRLSRVDVIDSWYLYQDRTNIVASWERN